MTALDMKMQDTTSSNMISRDPPPAARPRITTKSRNSSPLNFKVSEEFRREFKTYAAQHNMKLNQLLFHAFAALKERDTE